eukprot:1599189-Amphidinium_carterae.1
MLPTGARTPWPNRAETAVRLFKQELAKCCWARNTQLTISGYSPVELATGRRPPDQLDLELLTPEQLSTTPLRVDETIAHLRRLSIKSHLEVRQNQDNKRDLARRLQPSDGPLESGERVFVWIQDSSKFKDRGRWEPGRLPPEDQLLPFMDLDVPDDQPVESSNLASAGELSQCIADLVKVIQDSFTIPKIKRDNLKDAFDVRSVLFGVYTKQGSGCSQACSKWPAVLKAIHRLAKTRPKQEPYLAAQLFGTFKRGGRLWVEEENPGSSELVVPPSPIENGENAMGRDYTAKGKWLKFDGNRLHAVEAVKDNITRGLQIADGGIDLTLWQREPIVG